MITTNKINFEKHDEYTEYEYTQGILQCCNFTQTFHYSSSIPIESEQFDKIKISKKFYESNTLKSVEVRLPNITRERINARKNFSCNSSLKNGRNSSRLKKRTDKK